MPNTKPNNGSVFVSPSPPPEAATSNTQPFGTFSSSKGRSRKNRSRKSGGRRKNKSRKLRR
uniref:Uncharacterized protein n=1 Tax=viral metagenome TaxID=1070528 RepID=A0A6C0DK53_9ZZZZ